MMQATEGDQSIQANNNSVAVGNISIGGSISGNLTIGNTGYSADQVSALITQISSTFQPKPFDGHCPYRGLDAFAEEDAELFFGRERIVEDLISRIKESRTVFVTGPSGSGKSSLVRAGLIHALKLGAIRESCSERWLYETMKPGRDPLAELARVASRLAGTTNAEDEVRARGLTDASIFTRWGEIAIKDGRDKRAVIFVDQFEEVFTQISREEERLAFLNLLTHSAEAESGRIQILFSMRSDFIPNCATYPKLNALLNRQFVQIGAMQPEELVSAIAQPALRVGLKIDPDLIAQIINDMKGEPGALPLMQFTLKDLFLEGQKQGGMIALTLDTYLRHGGIQKSLERHADTVFGRLDQHEQELARSIFRGLIEIGRGTQDTKRTAIFDELIPANASTGDVEAIVQKLADARLITTDEAAGKDTVTISHEKLIDAWPWLRKLVNENREVIALQNEITENAREWDTHKRDPSYLYSGARLINAIEKLKSKELVLSGTAFEYIRAGQVRQKQSRLALISAVSLIFVLLVLAVIIFSTQSNANARQARENEQLAQQNADIANTAQAASKDALTQKEKAQLLSAQSLIGSSKLATDLNLSALLAIASFQSVPTANGEEQIRFVLSELPIPVYQMSQAGPIWQIEWTLDYKYFVTANKLDSANPDGTGQACVWQANDWEKRYCVQHDSDVNDALFTRDGKSLITAGSDGTVRFWEADSGKELREKRLTFNAEVIDLDVSDSLLAIGRKDNALTIYDMNSPDLRPVNYEQEDGVCAVEFSPDGTLLAIGLTNGNVLFWQVKDAIFYNGPKSLYSSYAVIAFSPDSNWLATGSGDSIARLAKRDGTTQYSVTHGDWVEDIAFGPDPSWYVTVSDDNKVRILDTATGREKLRMSHTNFAQRVEVSPDGQWIASTGYDRVVRIWDAISGDQMLQIPLDANGSAVSFNKDGTRIVTASENGTIRIWDISILKSRAGYITFPEYAHEARLTPSGRYLIVNTDDYKIRRIPAEEIAQIKDGTKGEVILNAKSLTYSTAISPDSKWVAAVEYDSANPQNNRGVLINLDEGTLSLLPHGGDVVGVAFTKDSKLAATVGANGLVSFWDVASGQKQLEFDNSEPVYSLAFSPLGGLAAMGLHDKTRIWNIDSRQPVVDIEQVGNIISVIFSQDGKWLATGSATGTVILWKVEGDSLTQTGDPLWINGTPLALTFSPDDKWLVGGSSSGFAHLWDVATVHEMARIPHNAPVTGISFSLDGSQMFTVARKVIRIWNIANIPLVPRDQLISSTCSHLLYNLSLESWKINFGDEEYQPICPNLPVDSGATTPQ